jgi:hypothetical protein
MKLLSEARAKAEEMGYTSVSLRASIHLSLALAESGEIQAAVDTVESARAAARQQGFEALEAEALMCRAKVAMVSSPGSNREIANYLRDSIEIASRIGAAPQANEAQGLLDPVVTIEESHRSVDLARRQS